MTVTNPIDGVQDLFSLTEADRRNREATSDATAAPTGDASESEKLETQFSRLLKGQLTENMVFTRIDQQLSLPQQVITDRSQAPVLDRRSDLPQNDDVDTYDPTDRSQDLARDVPAAPAAVDQPYEAAPRVDAPIRNDGRPAAAADAGNAGAAQQRGDGQQAAQQGNANSGNAANTSAAQNAANRTAAADALNGDVDIPELMELTQAAAKAGGGNIAGKVTVEQTQIASQPQAVLAAKASVDASAGRAANANAAASAEGDGLLADGEGSSFTNSIFAPGKERSTAAVAKGAGNAGANAQQGAEAGKANQPQAQAAAINQQAQLATRVGGMGNAQVSALTGATQSGVTVDASGAGTATLGENNSVQQRSAATPAQAAPRTPNLPQQALADQLAVNIQKGLNNGQDKITINLKPQELGRVEIKMEVAHDGKLTAVVSAERPETLDMLRQDARSLIQSLADAGLQADQSSLSFNLQGQYADANGGEAGGANGGQPGAAGGDDEDPFETGFLFQETGGISADGRLDVRI